MDHKRPYHRGGSQHDDLEVSKKQHQALLEGLFAPRPVHAGITKAGSSEIDSSSESRIDPAIRALLEQDAKRGWNGFHEAPTNSRNPSDSASYQPGVSVFTPVPQQPTRTEPPRALYLGARATHTGSGGAPHHRPPVHRGSSIEEPGYRDISSVPRANVPAPGSSVGGDDVGSTADGGIRDTSTSGRHSFERVRSPWAPEGMNTATVIPTHHVQGQWESAEPDGDKIATERDGRRSVVYEHDAQPRDEPHVPTADVVKVGPPVDKLPIDVPGTDGEDSEDGQDEHTMIMSPNDDDFLELPGGCQHVSLTKFLQVMTGPGLRVRKHHRAGKGSSGLRVLRYNEDEDSLVWDSHKILGAAQHVLPLSDVLEITMQEGNRVVLTCVGGKDSFAVFEAAKDDAAAVLQVGLERLRERSAARKG